MSNGEELKLKGYTVLNTQKEFTYRLVTQTRRAAHIISIFHKPSFPVFQPFLRKAQTA